MTADLIFPATYETKGFSSSAMAQHDGSPEPIVRELIQNSLDAAQEAFRGTPENPAEVYFTIDEGSQSDIPGLASYKNAFDEAVEQRNGFQRLGGPDQTVVDRIRTALAVERPRFLFCRDNGIGLDSEGIRRILTESNTNKQSGGGSFGVGHITAFAASDLRYVLYAGRTQRDGAIASGHAVLATHQSDKTLCAADGLYMEAWDLFTPEYPDPPPLLEQQLKQIDETGSVVCITAFNNFRNEGDAPENTVDAICRVAAINYLAAIWRGELVVQVLDRVADLHRTVDQRTLGEILEKTAYEQRARAQGWLAGSRAHRAWETLSNGRAIPSDGMEIRVRDLPKNTTGRSQVNIFRNGMWITYDAQNLRVSDFGGVKPFDAVVLLAEGEIYDLVRDAEGPEHRGLEPKRLNASKRAALRERLRGIASLLRNEVGEPDDTQEYIPAGFAVFEGNAMREASVQPRYRPRPTSTEISEPAITNTYPDGPSPNPTPPGPTPPKPPKQRPKGPAVGTAAAVRYSFKPDTNANDEVEALTVMWEPKEGHEARTELAVRVRVASGSDETCDQPIPPDWLELAAIEYDGASHPPGNNAWELPLPDHPGLVKIHLREPRPIATGIELDVVRRRVPSKKESG